MNRWQAYLALMRTDRPIGTWLLGWPTLWALLIAAEGEPSLRLVVIFALGVFLMRSAGCVINDFADRKIDGYVERTVNRPLATGVVRPFEALLLFLVLVTLAFLLVLTLNKPTIILSFVALGVAVLYPFTKRWTHGPQFILGIAFSMAIPMAFTAVQETLPFISWLLFAANLAWTVAYDTEYAMVDRPDDLKLGIKSTAVITGQYDRLFIAALQLATLGLLSWVGILIQGNLFYWLSLLITASLFIRQLWMIRHQDPQASFSAFKQNHTVGFCIALGIALHYWIPLPI